MNDYVMIIHCLHINKRAQFYVYMTLTHFSFFYLS